MRRSQKLSKVPVSKGDWLTVRKGKTVIDTNPFDVDEDPEVFAQRGMKAMFQSSDAKQQDIADKCTNKIVELLQLISVNRNNQTIPLYQIIEEILQMEKVSKMFIEGSSVMYMYDKFCQGKPDNELVRPGDIDLHIEYEGDWGHFTTSNDKSELDRQSQINTRVAELNARRKQIDVEKKQLMNEENVPLNQVQKQYQPEIDAIHHEKTELIVPKSTQSVISELLGLRSDNNTRSFAVMVDVPWLSNGKMKVDISKSIDLEIEGKGGINWKSNPQVELTVIDQITKEKYKNNIKNGFIVSDIPKLHFTRGEVLKIHRSAPPPQLEFENVSSNYTGISFTDPDGDLYKCSNFIKAFELYLRYKSFASLGELSDNPLIKFSQPIDEHHQLKCLQDLPEEIANWNGNEITLSECNKFLCGLIILISSKHEEDTIKTMLHKMKVMLINTYRNVDIRNTEMQITTFFLTCCVPCMTAGFCKREDCGNNIDKITAQISEILKEVFDLGRINQMVFKNKVKKYVTDSDNLVRRGHATGKKRRRQTRKKNKNKVTKRRRNKKGKSNRKKNKNKVTKRRRNKKGKSKRNKAKKTKRM